MPPKKPTPKKTRFTLPPEPKWCPHWCWVILVSLILFCLFTPFDDLLIAAIVAWFAVKAT
jgi:hypothetical protein